jgi:NADPH:quinone reductase-like Zn-dependent oxidoreductase
MKAYLHDEYGTADVLRLADVPDPQPGPDEVLIRVVAAGLNAADAHLLHGIPYGVRMVSGLRRPKHPIRGSDVSGVVAAVGSDVTQWRVGDEVISEVDRGGLAALVAIRHDLVVAKPTSVDHVHAAGLPMAGLTALQAVRDHGRVQAGERVLVNGASSGVGTFAVQLAVAFGATVTGVCSGRNAELVRSLGAADVIDYTTTDFTTTVRDIDVLVDCVSTRRYREVRRVLTPGGRWVLVGAVDGGAVLGINPQLKAKLATLGRSHSAHMVVAHRNGDDLRTLADMVDEGRIKPAVSRVYPWEDAVAAMRLVESGRAAGKVVVRVGDG